MRSKYHGEGGSTTVARTISPPQVTKHPARPSLPPSPRLPSSDRPLTDRDKDCETPHGFPSFATPRRGPARTRWTVLLPWSAALLDTLASTPLILVCNSTLLSYPLGSCVSVFKQVYLVKYCLHLLPHKPSHDTYTTVVVWLTPRAITLPFF